ncbi:S1/P1 nuclease [Botrimarina mediterranea]|uniref:S1/P1 nuclease n=1 Tax=Botrimarina mediterranea TaxID=2528022 RepID=UPI0018D2D4C7|nr:S1/P1 nuclease [Botrimarina mediterranea]
MVRILLLIAAFPALCHGWNAAGHEVIGLVAWQQLGERDRMAAVELLKEHPRFESHFLRRIPEEVWQASIAEQDQWVFAFAGTWPDLVRNQSDAVTSDDVRRFNRPRWHYINLPVWASPSDRDALLRTLSTNRRIEPPGDRDDPSMNVAQAVANSLRVLEDPRETRAVRAVHLAWFLHLAADLHQPCHATALYSADRFPEGDRGGNEVPVRGAGGKLHALWDQAILPRSNYNRIRRKAFELGDEHGKTGTAARSSLAPEAWLLESYQLAKQRVYTPQLLSAIQEQGEQLGRIDLPAAYHREAGEAADLRAVQAGYRIATLLHGRPPATETVQTTHRLERPVVDPEVEVPEVELGNSTHSATVELSHWINTKSGSRHNRSCKWYGKTKEGRYCTANEGHPCGQCGG